MAELSGPGTPYEPFEPEFTREIVEKVFGPAMDHYFRPRWIGADKIPDRGPIVLAPNHSGNAFPYDAMVLDASLWRRAGYPRNKFRPVFEKELTLAWWMRPYGVDNFWRRGGGVDMTFDNFDRLLARGERTLYYPEGVPGIGKGFARRYQLQPFSTSFVILAARHQAPVYPVYCINAEWIIPFQYTFKTIDRFMEKTFHVPFLPLPGALFAITFPWAWYLALPSRTIFVVGDPIDMRTLVLEEGETNFDRPDRDKMKRVAERVRQMMQPELDRHVRRYGRWPYQARLLLKQLYEARRRGVLARSLPTGWAPSFIRFERDQHRPPARGLRRWMRDFDLIPFYLPLGWPLLSLFRKLRRPPYGYRGLDRDQRQLKEGSFVWHLSRNPLPDRD